MSRGGGQVRRQRRAEHVPGAHEALVRHDSGVSGAKTADGCAGVFERGGDDVDAFGIDAEVLRETAAGLAHRTEGDGLVHDHARVVLVLERDEVGEGREPAGALEAPLGDEPASAAGAGEPRGVDAVLGLELGEHPGTVRGVAVVVPAHVHLGQTQPREDAVADAAVNHGNVRPVTQSRDDRRHRARAVRVHDSLLDPEKVRDGALQVHVRREGSVEPARGARAEAEFLHRSRASLLHHRVVGKSQDVRGGEHDLVLVPLGLLLGDPRQFVRVDGPRRGPGRADIVPQGLADRVKRREPRPVCPGCQLGRRVERGGPRRARLGHALDAELLFLLLLVVDAAGEPRVGRGNLKLDGQFIRDVANRGEGVGEILARVSRRDAEANAGVVDGRGRGADDDDRELAVERQPGEVPDLVRLVEHHRHDGRRVVTEHLQTERLQPLAEKLGVFAELPELLGADVRAVLPGDDPQGREDLGAHRRGHGARVRATRRVLPDPRDGFVIRRDVTTRGAE